MLNYALQHVPSLLSKSEMLNDDHVPVIKELLLNSLANVYKGLCIVLLIGVPCLS